MNDLSVFERVCAMNVSFGNPKGDPAKLDWQRITKQCSNIKSELRELRTACEAKHKADVRDALCDIKVFAMGGLHFMGQSDPAPVVFSRGRYSAIDWDVLGLANNYLDDLFNSLMKNLTCLDEESTWLISSILGWIVEAVSNIQAGIGADPDADMHAVIDGVLTRFCRDEAELQATKLKYDTLGVKYYVEGVFPEVCLKSAEDQGDEYPKGKFLKSVGYRLPVFPALL